MGRYRARPKTWYPGKYHPPTSWKYGPRIDPDPVDPDPVPYQTPDYPVPKWKKFSDLMRRR